MEMKQIQECYVITVLLYIGCLWRYNKVKTENLNFQVRTVCLRIGIRLDQIQKSIWDPFLTTNPSPKLFVFNNMAGLLCMLQDVALTENFVPSKI